MGIAVHTDMAMPPILKFGTEEQKQEWVVPAIAGDKILCLGITEPDAGSDVAGIKTRAVRDNGEYVINGSKTYITNGHRADAIVLVTKTDPDAGYDGFTLFLVPMDLPGVIREKKLEKLGMHASDTALLAFQDVRVPSSAVLGQVGKGFYHIMWELQGERLIGAAGCVAGAQRCFDMTLQYAKERTAFGRQIGHFQVVRHKFAEMATKIESARQMVYSTAWRFQNGEYPVREISMAKLHAARVAVEVADESIQIHGGASYMKEYCVERVWADRSTEFPAASGRYHLYVSMACPWSHRTVIVRRLKGLEDAISISYAHPYRDERGWAFPGGEYADELNGFAYLAEAYERTRPGYDGRVTVPVLWDRETGRIVCNESAEII